MHRINFIAEYESKGADLNPVSNKEKFLIGCLIRLRTYVSIWMRRFAVN
jgi:hypothetical protein